MKRTTSERGINVIGTILMLVAFFLVIGFGIGALATMNLNLSGRSVNSVKANQLAEAVVSEVMHYAQVQAGKSNTSISLSQMAAPSLYLDTRFDGVRNVFEPMPSYLGDNCSADVHFGSKGGGDRYFSTDNINVETPNPGARGIVPPFTIDLIVNVTIGSFQKHYQVFITRRWDYVLYCQDAPVHLLSCYDFTTNPPAFKKGTEINGTFYSRFKADPTKTYNQYIFLGEIPPHTPPLPYSGSDMYIGNFIPSKLYPAALFIGGDIFNKTVGVGTPPPVSYVPAGTLEHNQLNGGGTFSFAFDPADPPICVYPNNGTGTKKNAYGSMVSSPIDVLKPLDDSEVTCTPLNDKTEHNLRLIKDYIGRYRFKPGLSGTPKVDYDKDGNPIADSMNLYNLELQGKLRDEFTAKKTDYALSTRNVLFVERGITTYGTPSPNDFEWGVSSRFVIQAEDGEYCPLVDMYMTAKMSDWNETKTTNPDGSYSITAGFSDESFTGQIDDHENKITFNNSMIVARANLELSHSAFVGDNTMLQVDANISLAAGKISAGKKVGTVVFCKNFRCAATGVFRGVIFAKNSVKIGNPFNTDAPDMKGVIIIGGADPDPDPLITSIDYGGFVSHGLTLTYDPQFAQILNRFGKFRITSWREID
jgi:hypothetical protein